MVRTRDFFLYAGVLIFLLLGIATTILTDQWRAAPIVEETVDLEPGSEPGAIVSINDDTQLRQANLERLKQKLAEEDDDLPEVILTTVDEDPSVEEVGESGASVVGAIEWCGPLSQSSLPEWPKGKVSVGIVEGVRVVSYDSVSFTQIGSSTEAATSTKTLLQLPVLNGQAAEPSCLDSLAVGVTKDGGLLLNSSASLYQSAGEYFLIGYARDGFPIYGLSPNESELDNCGGRMTAAGYQYHIRSGSFEVLNCFSGIPAKFLSP